MNARSFETRRRKRDKIGRLPAGNRASALRIRNSGASAKPKALAEPLNSGARVRMVIELSASVYTGRKSEF
jgi:hypothetical protein